MPDGAERISARRIKKIIAGSGIILYFVAAEMKPELCVSTK